MTFGSSETSCSRTFFENSAPPEPTTNSELRSYSAPCSAIASASGRAIASPTMVIVITRSRSMSARTFFASNDGTTTCEVPRQKALNMLYIAAPWISGAVSIQVIAGMFAACAATDAMSECGSPIGLPPDRAAWKKSSARHITPLGMPVVPPV